MTKEHFLGGDSLVLQLLVQLLVTVWILHYLFLLEIPVGLVMTRLAVLVTLYFLLFLPALFLLEKLQQQWHY
jgi:hypothetical protein